MALGNRISAMLAHCPDGPNRDLGQVSGDGGTNIVRRHLPVEQTGVRVMSDPRLELIAESLFERVHYFRPPLSGLNHVGVTMTVAITRPLPRR
jgi:hypothetical protein